MAGMVLKGSMKKAAKKVKKSVPSLTPHIDAAVRRARTLFRKAAVAVITNGDYIESLAGAVMLNKIDECFGAELETLQFNPSEIKSFSHIEDLADVLHTPVEEIVSAVVTKAVVSDGPEFLKNYA